MGSPGPALVLAAAHGAGEAVHRDVAWAGLGVKQRQGVVGGVDAGRSLRFAGYLLDLQTAATWPSGSPARSPSAKARPRVRGRVPSSA